MKLVYLVLACSDLPLLIAGRDRLWCCDSIARILVAAIGCDLFEMERHKCLFRIWRIGDDEYPSAILALQPCCRALDHSGNFQVTSGLGFCHASASCQQESYPDWHNPSLHAPRKCI